MPYFCFCANKIRGDTRRTAVKISKQIPFKLLGPEGRCRASGDSEVPCGSLGICSKLLLRSEALHIFKIKRLILSAKMEKAKKHPAGKRGGGIEASSW